MFVTNYQYASALLSVLCAGFAVGVGFTGLFLVKSN